MIQDKFDAWKRSEELLALQAWGKVESTLKHLGRESYIIFNDPLISIILSTMGSWPILCGRALDEMPSIANLFMELYLHYLALFRMHGDI